MDAGDFLTFIIQPTTDVVGLRSQASDILLLGTAIIESELTFLEQKGPGNGLGVYQIESDTHKDILRYLNRHDKRTLKETCLAACFYTAPPSDDALIHNLRYATVIARLKYWMSPEELPAHDNAKGLAAYHKHYYNSSFGKTNVSISIKAFERVIHEFRGRI